MDDIFVSYSRKDRERAVRLKQRLEDVGYSVWMDEEDLHVGRAWQRQIVEGIDACKLYIIMLTANSIRSDNVRRELDLARSRYKTILPIYTPPEPVQLSKDMEYQLVGLQRIPYDKVFEDGIEKILTELTTVSATEEMQLEEFLWVALLRPVSGPVVPLAKDELVVGRGPDADVDLTPWDRNRYVSKRHGELKCTDGNWKLRVCKASSNPTLLNGLAVAKGEEVDLKYGDTIIFADVRFTFERREEP